MPELVNLIHEIKRTQDIAGLLHLRDRYDLSKIKCIIDFAEINFFSPLQIVVLAQHLILLVNQGCATIVLINHPKYLDEIGIVDFCNSNHRRPFTIERIRSQTAMPIKRVSTENLAQYIEMAQSFIRQFCPGKDLDILGIGISELINNVYDHSASEIGAYVFGQYYPVKRQVKIAVSDAGIGIPHCVNRHLQHLGYNSLSGTECLQWAFRDKNTTQSTPGNRGRGLSTIASFLSATDGSLRLLTESTGEFLDATGVKYFTYPAELFKGTAVEITIKIDNLHDIDEDEFSFEI